MGRKNNKHIKQNGSLFRGNSNHCREAAIMNRVCLAGYKKWVEGPGLALNHQSEEGVNVLLITGSGAKGHLAAAFSETRIVNPGALSIYSLFFIVPSNQQAESNHKLRLTMHSRPHPTSINMDCYEVGCGPWIDGLHM